MSNNNAEIDGNFERTLLAVSSVDGQTIVQVWADPTTHRLLVDDTGGGVATFLQKDVFTSTNGQTAFTATKTIAFDQYLSINGLIQTPTTDYTISGEIITLTAGSYPNGVPANTPVIFLYATG